MNENDDLRQLFADATSDIRPQGSLDDILDRSKKVDPMTRRWFLPVVAAAAVIGLAIGGAAWLANDSSSPKGSGGPAGPPSTSPTVGSVQRPTKLIDVYYLGDTAAGPRLFSEKTSIEAPEGEGEPVYTLGAAQKALEGKPHDADYYSAWPATAKVSGTAQNADDPSDTITVFFDDASAAQRPDGMSAAVARLSVEQLVRSVQAAANSTAPVDFRLAGITDTPLDSILGVAIKGSFSPGDDDTVLAPVQISSPADGATVKPGDLTVEGKAATFEANVIWELKDGDTVVQNGHTTATECCTLAPYSFTIKDVQPGSYTLVVHDEDMSGEGRAVNQDTKEIVVE